MSPNWTPLTKWTEKHVQMALYELFNKRRHVMMCPNSKALWFSGESDFVSINQTGLAIEVEIKVSEADFKAEFANKKRKHRILAGKKVPEYTWQPGAPEVVMDHEVNYYYFACPTGLIQPQDLPDYAGLIYVSGYAWPSQNMIRYTCSVVIEPTKLHKRPLNDKRLKVLQTGVMHRCFKFLGNHLTEQALTEIS